MSQKLLLKGLSFQTLDTQVLGDIKRLARVPYSCHEKSLKPCTPVTFDREIQYLSDLSLFKSKALNIDFCKLCLQKIKQGSRRRIVNFPKSASNGVRPCLRKALNTDLNDCSGHSIRVAIAVEFLKAVYSPEEVAELFKKQDDFSFDKSLYHVKYISERGYKHFKCTTIRALGFCLENCSHTRIIVNHTGSNNETKQEAEVETDQ